MDETESKGQMSLPSKLEAERQREARGSAEWKSHKKGRLRTSTGRAGPLCTKFPFLKDDLIEAFRSGGGEHFICKLSLKLLRALFL